MYWSRDIGFDYLAGRAGLEVMAAGELLDFRFHATPTMTAALSIATRNGGFWRPLLFRLGATLLKLPGRGHSATTKATHCAFAKVDRDDAGAGNETI